MRSFSAQVDEWVRQTEQRTTAVFRESAQRVIADMQTPVSAGGNMPVDTGFLRASLQVAINAAPAPVARPNPGGGLHAYSDGSVAATIGGAEIGDLITASYGAAYARAIEYGSEGRAPRAFVRSAAQKWPSIVAAVASELKGRVAMSRR